LTRLPENCGHQVGPSELFTNTVRTPCCTAWVTIAAGSPPLERLTYQIHMPVPSRGDPDASRGVVDRSTLIGPNAFDRRPFGATTRMCPLFAASGTVATKAFVFRSRAVTVPEPALPVRSRRNSTVIPERRWRPLNRSAPPGETTCGPAPHVLGGQHRTEWTCGTFRCRLAPAGTLGASEASSAKRATEKARLRHRGLLVNTTPSLAYGVS